MAMDPNFESVGQAFCKFFFETFQTNRAALKSVFSPGAMMTFEGAQCQGPDAITAKLVSLPFASVTFVPTTTDCQPLPSYMVNCMVVGQLKTDNDPPNSFSTSFVLIKSGDTYLLNNFIFRLSLHNM